MLYCRMFVEWFSQKMVGPFFISSFGSSAVRAQGIAQIPEDGYLTGHGFHDSLNARDKRQCPSSTWVQLPPEAPKAVNQCQEERARQAANSKKTRPHSSHNARHSMQSAGCVVCQSTTRRRKTPLMIHSISITSIPSRSTPNCSSTRQASSQATPAATGSEATKTHQHQSAH